MFRIQLVMQMTLWFYVLLWPHMTNNKVLLVSLMKSANAPVIYAWSSVKDIPRSVIALLLLTGLWTLVLNRVTSSNCILL